MARGTKKTIRGAGKFQKPWEKLGVSKSTFYRKKKRMNVTSPGDVQRALIVEASKSIRGLLPTALAKPPAGRLVWQQVPTAPAAEKYSVEQEKLDNAARRALAENFIIGHDARLVLQRPSIETTTVLTPKTAAALAHYAAIGLIHDDARREREAQEVPDAARAA